MTRSISSSYDEDFFAWTQEQPSMRRLIDMDRVWQQGRRRADATLKKMGSAMSAPQTCPFTLDELIDDAFDLEGALHRLPTNQMSGAGNDTGQPPAF